MQCPVGFLYMQGDMTNCPPRALSSLMVAVQLKNGNEMHSRVTEHLYYMPHPLSKQIDHMICRLSGHQNLLCVQGGSQGNVSSWLNSRATAFVPLPLPT